MQNTQVTTEPAPDAPDAPAKGNRVQKALLIAFDVLLYLFLAFSVVMLILSFSISRNDGAGNLFGFEMRIVVSESMQKSEYSFDVSGYEIGEIKLRSMVFIERVPEDEKKAQEWYGALREGDVLTFAYVSAVSQDVITHRIVKIEPTEHGFLITLRGDNRASADAVVSEQRVYTSSADYGSQNDRYNYVIGKVVGQSVALGNLVYGIRQPVGIALIVILPCSLIIIWQIARVINVVSEDRKRKAAERIANAERLAAEEQAKRDEQARELDELKRKVAELEQKNSGAGDSDGGGNGTEG